MCAEVSSIHGDEVTTDTTTQQYRRQSFPFDLTWGYVEKAVRAPEVNTNDRPDLSSEWALHKDKKEIFRQKLSDGK
jgi:hypothetical protein